VSKSETHSWAIDSIEERVASVEVDGKQMVQLPQWMLPPAAKEGDVLAVTHGLSDDGTRSTLSIFVDSEATRTAHERSVAVPKKTGKEKVDPGGDIKF
jgi:hypothetical protein